MSPLLLGDIRGSSSPAVAPGVLLSCISLLSRCNQSGKNPPVSGKGDTNLHPPAPSPCNLSAMGDIGFPYKPDFLSKQLRAFQGEKYSKSRRTCRGCRHSRTWCHPPGGFFWRPGRSGLAEEADVGCCWGAASSAQGAARAPWAGGARTEVSRCPQLQIACAVGRILGSASPGARGRLLRAFDTALGLECSGSAQPRRAT